MKFQAKYHHCLVSFTFDDNLFIFQLDEDELETINSFLDPILAANLTNDQVFTTFEELLQASDPEEFLSQISGNWCKKCETLKTKIFRKYTELE